MIFYLILFGVPLLNSLWWVWADRRLRLLPRSRRWRALLALFMAFQLGIYALAIATRALNLAVEVPLLPLSVAYLWHLLVLPVTAFVVAVVVVGSFLRRQAAKLPGGIFRNRRRQELRPAGSPSPAAPEAEAELELRPTPVSPRADTAEVRLSRRQFLAAAAVAAPPLLVGAGVARALPKLDEFRIRRIELPLAGLPRALDGVTLAHITDVHVGRYSDERLLREIVRQTNALRTDLVVLTGDLIDHDLEELPAALDMVRRLDARHGVFMCEGNHDLFESREAFESRVKASGVPLLLNEAADLTVNGHPLQVLGLKWGAGEARRRRRDPALLSNLAETLSRRDPEAFSLLLAHHPHIFDAAAAAGLPLTLAGHTHGGQIMLNNKVGLAPVAFKYWSGVYRRDKSALVVSNGVGNWFPLRVNAPAEVIHMTLRSA